MSAEVIGFRSRRRVASSTPKQPSRAKKPVPTIKEFLDDVQVLMLLRPYAARQLMFFVRDLRTETERDTPA